MQAKCRFRSRNIEESLVEHERRAAAFAFGHAFLGGLEHEQDLAGQAIPHFHQDFRRAHQDCRVAVVTAGVHDADGSSPELAGRRRPERHIGFFRDRQGVHVGPQQDRGAGQLSFDHGDDAGMRHPRPRLEAERTQILGDFRGGAHLAIREFGIAVKIPPPFDDFRLDGRRRGIELGRGNGCACDRRGECDCEGHQER